jgi:hypothetical protein
MNDKDKDNARTATIILPLLIGIPTFVGLTAINCLVLGRFGFASLFVFLCSWVLMIAIYYFFLAVGVSFKL